MRPALPPLIVVTLSLALAACSSASGPEGNVPEFTAEPDVVDSQQVDVPADAPTNDAETTADAPSEATDATPEADVPVPLPELPTRQPLPTPADPLEGAPVSSCALFQQERCEGGVRQVCAVYDTKGLAFPTDDSLDPLLRRALLFDRWRDLYHRVDGQLAERVFSGPTPPGTPEAEWGAPEHFAAYAGGGDSGIWTGWAVNAAILRYSQTGTTADYQRMEDWVRGLVMKWDVTGIPGYLSRYHYIHLPAGGPNDPAHYIRWGDDSMLNWMDHQIADPQSVPGLPSAYWEGVKVGDAEPVKGVARWHGRPSIDQVTGSVTALPMAFDLLKDEALKARITHHLTCYMKRLQRVELVNLQDNADALQAFMDYFGGGQLTFEPEDIDFSKLDRIVGYVQRQINSKNAADFDTSCPDTIQMEPWRTIDAGSPAFVGQLLQFVMDMGGYEQEREQGIDHYYFPSIRGGDAMHLMHLATIAWHLTGDEQYREFLHRELIPEIRTVEVAYTAGSFDPPNTCKKFFGDQITFGPWCSFLHLLDDCPLRTDLQKAFHVEFWEKLMHDVGNIDFNIMYVGALPPEIATAGDEALDYALAQLQRFGGNGGVLDDPRRQYSRTAAEVMAQVPAGIEAICPTQLEIDHCEAEIDFMGVKLPGLVATHDCTGSEWECTYDSGKCAPKEASKTLPVDLRPFTDYIWQRNPFELGRMTGVEGGVQYPGSDYSVPYWNARRYGFVTAGAGQVLAWKDAGACE